MAFGATILFAEEIASASEAKVDQAWNDAISKPWSFHVSEFGTISVPDIPGPSINRDVFNIRLDQMDTDRKLIWEIEGCEPLVDHFRSLAADEKDEIADRLAAEGDPLVRQNLEQSFEALDDEYNGWRELIKMGGQSRLAEFMQIIESWLEEPLDWDQMEVWPKGWNGQDQAVSFFRDYEAELAEALGIKIIEGDHPGSSYVGAELTLSTEDANRIAEEMKLPFRFISD